MPDGTQAIDTNSMTREELELKIAEEKRFRDKYQKEADDLGERYRGCRPSWVSTDIAIAQTYANSHAQLVEAYEFALTAVKS